jgi:hypothetical protein
MDEIDKSIQYEQQARRLEAEAKTAIENILARDSNTASESLAGVSVIAQWAVDGYLYLGQCTRWNTDGITVRFYHTHADQEVLPCNVFSADWSSPEKCAPLKPGLVALQYHMNIHLTPPFPREPCVGPCPSGKWAERLHPQSCTRRAAGTLELHGRVFKWVWLFAGK